MKNLAELDKAHVWHPFTQMAEWDPLVITDGEGSFLIDEAGNRYLDGVSSLWVNVHGHRHQVLNKAIQAQLERIAHSTLLGLANQPSIELAQELVALAPQGLTKVFYSDSGSTAVEVALKMAFQCHQNRGQSKRTRFLTLAHAYHGDTIGSVSVGGIDLFHKIFQPLLFYVERIPATFEALEAAFRSFGEELCAMVVEPLVQGAAGMLLQPPGFLHRARELCSQHGVLLIVDEVATGFGRSGTLFACEQESVAPDLLCLAKGLTGGYLPLAATMATEAIYQSFLGSYAEWKTFFHGHSYTGNPLCCAAALANLQIFRQEEVLRHLPEKIRFLRQSLRGALLGHPHVREIRQCGMMVGIELQQRPGVPYPAERGIGAAVCRKVREYGVILRPLGAVVVLMPPLSISLEEISLLVDATTRALGILE